MPSTTTTITTLRISVVATVWALSADTNWALFPAALDLVGELLAQFLRQPARRPDVADRQVQPGHAAGQPQHALRCAQRNDDGATCSGP